MINLLVHFFSMVYPSKGRGIVSDWQDAIPMHISAGRETDAYRRKENDWRIVEDFPHPRMDIVLALYWIHLLVSQICQSVYRR